MFRKKRWRHVGFHGFVGDRLGAVLTELEGRPMFGVWPGASGAIKSVVLVDQRQRFDRFVDAHFREAVNGGRDHRWNTRRFFLGLFHFQTVHVGRCSCL